MASKSTVFRSIQKLGYRDGYYNGDSVNPGLQKALTALEHYSPFSGWTVGDYQEALQVYGCGYREGFDQGLIEHLNVRRGKNG